MQDINYFKTGMLITYTKYSSEEHNPARQDSHRSTCSIHRRGAGKEWSCGSELMLT